MANEFGINRLPERQKSDFQPYGVNKFFNQEDQNIFNKLEDIEAAINSGSPPPELVPDFVELEIAAGVTESVEREIFYGSIDNSEGDGNVLVSLETNAGGTKTLTVKQGTIYNFQYMKNYFYQINTIENEGSSSVQFTAFALAV